MVATHLVAVLAVDGVIPFELGIPGQIFGAAVTSDGQPLYRVIVCSVDGQPVRTGGGFTIVVDHDADVLARADTVVLPPAHRACPPSRPVWAAAGPPVDAAAPPGDDVVVDAVGVDDVVVDDVVVDDVVVDDVVAAAGSVAAAFARVRPGARIVSICTASFLLAAVGLLDGRPATTHWADADRLRRAFPRVRVDSDVLFVDDGDVLTSAGAASGVDLCLHLIRRDHGSEVANRAARLCVVPPWRDGGQSQYIERPVPLASATSTAATRVWMLERLSETTALRELAAHAGMSVRTFTRRFRAEVGLTPGQWLTGQRVERARHLLEGSDLSIDQVARRVGFATDVSLRRHFRAATGVSPNAYRHTFQARAG
jgi:transcriptional regulator GlxA family with amidase domain